MRKMKLTQNKYALVDDEDYELVSRWKWHAAKVSCRSNTLYAVTRIAGKTMYMHRLILNVPKGKVTDHINGDGLDNRRSNIRICSQKQNVANSKRARRGRSKYKGVYWHKAAKKWCVQLGRRGENRKYLGLFEDEQAAALAYNKAAEELYGSYARLNEVR